MSDKITALSARHQSKIDEIDDKIIILKRERERMVQAAQDKIKAAWSEQSPYKAGARVVVGPKWYELRVWFIDYKPLDPNATLKELNKDGFLKEVGGTSHDLKYFLSKHPDAVLVNPTDPGYAKLRPINAGKLKEYRGFKVGQEVEYRSGSRWNRHWNTGTIVRFTPTGKVTVQTGGARQVFKIEYLRPVRQEEK